MGFAASDQNLYRYVGNHPTDATDPSGLAELPAITVVAKPVDGLQGQGTQGGISITATTTDKAYKDKIKFIQFVQISAQVQFTYSKTCQGTSSYVTVAHEHGGATFYTSAPAKPYWNFDNLGKKDTPEFPIFDLTPLDESRYTYQILDWPVITQELPGEIEKSEWAKKTIQQMEAARPNDGKVTCSATVTAAFQTFIIVDGKVHSKVSWSVGNGYYPQIGNPTNKPMDEKLLQKLQDAFPKYKLENLPK
jgi:hypothetical protein